MTKPDPRKNSKAVKKGRSPRTKARPIGRPPIPETKRRIKLGLSLPPDLAKAIHLLADENNTTVSAIAEDALLKAIGLYSLRRKEKP